MPGPSLLRSLKYSFEFKKNYLRPMEELFAEYGDYVSFNRGASVVLAFHPDAVEHVLKTNAKNYLKAQELEELHPMLGLGLLTNEGESWREHRRVIAPEFQHKKIDVFFKVMQTHLEQILSEWRQLNQPIDIAPAISRVTYRIAGECFFGANLESTADLVYRNIDIASGVAVKRMASPFKLPRRFPTPANFRVKKAVREMNSIVYGIIDQRIANLALHDSSRGEASDVLTRLTRINTASGAPHFSRTEIRDEVMTLLLAGHETTANALSWTLFLLAKYPEIQNQLRDEIRAQVADATPTLAEIKNLSFTEMVLKESMRLYPPAATVGRYSIDEDEIGGYLIPAKTKMNLAQWITHRHPGYWSNPNEFNPQRFSQGEPKHPYAYFPFGAGARECIGRNMAMIEGMALLAGFIRSFRFELIRTDVKVRPLITLRPDPGIVMKVSPWN